MHSGWTPSTSTRPTRAGDGSGLLDDAFAKVSEDNHERLFGLLIALDLDFVVTSERLCGTHASVPALSIVEVLRDPDLRTIALVHYHWRMRCGRTSREASPWCPIGFDTGSFWIKG